MRRITWWALSTVSAVVLLFGYHTSTSGASATGTTGTSTRSGSFASSGSATTTSGSGTGGGDDTATPSPTPSSSPGSTPSTAATTRTVDGSVVDTRWGPVQVRLTIVGGRITRASVLQYPDGNPRDAEINDQALPILTRETIAAQSAKIDMVSGATYTSDGYIGSLQSALDQAGL